MHDDGPTAVESHHMGLSRLVVKYCWMALSMKLFKYGVLKCQNII